MSNVLINGRTAVHADSKGVLNTVDVCLTQFGNAVVPIPYPNVAQSKDADQTAASVLINGKPACTIDSTFSKSRGDEPGNRKGIKSGTKGGEASFIKGSANVKIEGAKAARALDMMVSNKQNTPPAPLMQPMGMPAMPAMTTEQQEIELEATEHMVAIKVEGSPEHVGDGAGAQDDAFTVQPNLTPTNSEAQG